MRIPLMALLASLLLTSTAVAASTTPQAPSALAPLQLNLMEVDQSQYPVVQLHFQLRRPGGEVLPPGAVQEVKLVEGLSGGNQVEVSGGKVVPLGHQPVRVLALVDVSESMEAPVGSGGERKIDAVKRALVSLVELLQPGDQFAVMTYHLEPGAYVEAGDRPGREVRDHFDFLTGENYVTSRSAALNGLNRLEVPRSYTAYTNTFNAAVAALDWDQLKRKPGDPVTQLLLLTDGMDNRADVVKRVVASGRQDIARVLGESRNPDQVVARAR
jgi:hypothetical protein